MNTLLTAPLNYPCKIKALHIQDQDLLNRLMSFGIRVESVVTPLYHSSKKATIAIQVHRSQVALRSSEAQKIEIYAKDE